MSHHTSSVAWGYSDTDGPDRWAQMFGAGKNQSPINIQLANGNRKSAACCHGKPTGLSHQSAHKRSDSVNSTGHSSDSNLTEDESNASGRPSSSSSSESETNSRSSSLSSGSPASNKKPQQQNLARNKCPASDQQTRYVVNKRKLFLGYPRYLHSMRLCNTGHGWQVSLPDELAEHTLLTGPPLADREYRLLQFHCHWGADCDHGSEHQINGQSFSAELHFVHWNCSDFSSAQEASRHKHGLAVLAVLVQALEGEQNRNKHLDKVAQQMELISRPNAEQPIQGRLDMKKLFPQDRWNYATYEGSLTTPPLSEVVDWLVFLQPIQCSTSQIEQFRKLKCPTSKNQPSKLISNCRPVQPTNGRTVTIWSHH